MRRWYLLLAAVVIGITLVVVLRVMVFSPAQAPRMSPVTNRADVLSASDENVLPIIEEYVTSTRGWSRDEYWIQNLGAENDLVIYKIFYKRRDEPVSPGGGKSFQAFLDTNARKIVKELGYQ